MAYGAYPSILDAGMCVVQAAGKGTVRSCPRVGFVVFEDRVCAVQDLIPAGGGANAQDKIPPPILDARSLGDICSCFRRLP